MDKVEYSINKIGIFPGKDYSINIDKSIIKIYQIQVYASRDNYWNEFQKTI